MALFLLPVWIDSTNSVWNIRGDTVGLVYIHRWHQFLYFFRKKMFGLADYKKKKTILDNI